MSLIRKYKFELSHNGTTVEVYPQQSDLNIQFQKNDTAEFFFRRVIKNSLQLFKSDYQWVYDIDQLVNRCIPIEVTITRRSTNTIFFFGKSHIDKCRFDKDRKVAVLKVESHDKYSEFLRVYDREINILEGTAKVCYKNNYTDFVSEIQVVTDAEQTLSIGFPGGQQFPNTNWPDFDFGWKITYDRVKIIDEGVPGSPIVAKRYTSFAREIVPTADLPVAFDIGAWSLAPGGLYYFRDVDSVLIESSVTSELEAFGETPGEWYYESYTKAYYVQFLEPDYCNGIRLETVLTKFLAGTGITTQSNLYGINESGGSPSNDVYADDRLKNLLIFQRTDIKYPTASQPASIMKMSFKTFLVQLQKQHNIIYWLEGDVLRIEHDTWKAFLPNGYDWTALSLATLQGTNQYDYDNREYPTGEAIYQEGESFSTSRFKRLQWVYDYTGEEVPNNCAPAFTTEIETVADITCNDIAAIRTNPDAFNDLGMTIVCVHEYEGELFVSGPNNGYMAPRSLAYLWTSNRYFEHAIYRPPSGGITFFYFTTRRTRKQVQFSVIYDEFEDFNELLLQKSGLGWGEILECEYSAKKCELKLTLLHD